MSEVNFIGVKVVFEIPTEVADEAVKLSKFIAKNRKVFFTLDKHLLYPLQVHPHITIYDPEFPEHNLDSIIENTRQIARKSKPVQLAFTNMGFNDGGYAIANFALTPEISRFQKNIINGLDSLREGHVMDSIKDLMSSEPNHDMNYMDKYGAVHIFEFYKPHLSLTRFQNAADAKALTVHAEWNVKTFTCDRIGVYLCGDHETLKEPLEEFLLGNL